MPPAESRKPAVITVGGNPFAPRFNRQRSPVSIPNQITLNARGVAKPDKDFPVAVTRRHPDAIGLTAEFDRETESRFQRTRWEGGAFPPGLAPWATIFRPYGA